MKITRSQQEIAAATANPSAEALKGYSLEKELRKAAKLACKPIAAKLAHYRTECRRLEDLRDKWSGEAYEQKMNDLTRRAYDGDVEAEAAIHAGAVPSKQSYNEMHARYCCELDEFQRLNARHFGEARLLIEEPMTAAVARGQAILDNILDGLGVTRFELTGWANHVTYVCQQLERASRNECADLAPFWGAVES